MVESYGKTTGFFGVIKTQQELFQLVTKDFNVKFNLTRTERQIRDTWNTIKDTIESEDEGSTSSDDDNDPKEKSRMTNAERVEFMLATRDKERKKEQMIRREERKQERLEMMELFFQKLGQMGKENVPP